MLEVQGFLPQALALGLVFAVLYLLVLRPPRQLEARRFRDVMALKGGEEVVTADGCIGRVIEAEAGRIVVELAEGLRVTVGQKGIVSVRQA
jgi:preprotein translocase YajC subunit